MELDYLTVYIEINALCFIITGIILFSVKTELGSEFEVETFKWMLRVMLVALALDAFTHAQLRGAIHPPTILVAICYALYMFLFSGVLSFTWFLFAESRLGSKLISNRKKLCLAAIPVLFLGVASFLSLKMGWFFYMDDAGFYVRGKYWVVQSLVAYAYFLVTTVHAFYLASKEQSPRARRQYYALSRFIIAPIIGAILQLLIGGHPFVGPSVCISILIIFLNIQSGLIYHDALTGLNNRKSCNEFLEGAISRASDEDAWYLYLIDVDKFKKINDKYGHNEGDRCLKYVASVLRRGIGAFDGYLARFGGDEFICVINDKMLDNPEQFIDHVNEVAESDDRSDINYDVDLSFGYCRCDSPNEKASKLIKVADQMMYHNKREKNG